jgi:hypothetical protein
MGAALAEHKLGSRHPVHLAATRPGCQVGHIRSRPAHVRRLRGLPGPAARRSPGERVPMHRPAAPAPRSFPGSIRRGPTRASSRCTASASAALRDPGLGARPRHGADEPLRPRAGRAGRRRRPHGAEHGGALGAPRRPVDLRAVSHETRPTRTARCTWRSRTRTSRRCCTPSRSARAAGQLGDRRDGPLPGRRRRPSRCRARAHAARGAQLRPRPQLAGVGAQLPDQRRGARRPDVRGGPAAVQRARRRGLVRGQPLDDPAAEGADDAAPLRRARRLHLHRQTDYSRDFQGVRPQRYIVRYRLEPSDTAAWLRGELVEPVKPWVWYIDPATPEE